MFEYHTLNDLIKLSADNNLEIWEIIQQADMYENDRSESDSFNMMKEMYVAMKNADSMYDGTLRSASNKAGGDGGLLHSYNESGKNICGSFMGKVMEKAIKMGESKCLHEAHCCRTDSRFMWCSSCCPVKLRRRF